MDDEAKLELGVKAKAIIDGYRGILAADESPDSIKRKFTKYNIENSEENRRKFREMLFTAPGLEKYIGGVILHEETYKQKSSDGQYLIDILKQKKIEVGIKLDKGLITFLKNEKLSVGIDDLDIRIKNFPEATFAKWRSLFILGDDLPTKECIIENCAILAKYALLCQQNGLVPIVEPEIYYEGKYCIDEACFMTKLIVGTLIMYLNVNEVYLPGVLIKISFVASGKDYLPRSKPEDVGSHTLSALLSIVPCAIPGIVFLSGGHTAEESISYLKEVNQQDRQKTWSSSFSFGRALSDEPMSIWRENDDNREEAQKALLTTAEQCQQAMKK